MAAVSKGAAGEILAARFLREKGYTVLAANYHSRFGEIDIIAADGPYIVFVEVKTRSQQAVYAPREAVTRAKQQKILRTAMLYLRAFPTDKQPRFDVVEVWTDSVSPLTALQIDHLIGAYEAGDLHEAFDLHCDTLYECERNDWSLRENAAHIDLARGLSCYDAWAQVMAVFVPDTLRGDAAWRHTVRVLDFAAREAARHADCMTIVRTAADMETALQSGRCAVLPAVEGGAAIGGEVSRLSELAARGVAALNITWNGSNELANGCMSPDKGGLTPLGREAVRRLYTLGIVPDVSHLNEQGFWDVAALADGRPFLAGHSVSAAVQSHPRNLTDEQFCAVRDSGGLVGLNLCADQLGGQAFEQLYRHLEHFWSLGGEQTVVLGCDLDGTDLPPSWGGIAFAARFYAWLEQKNIEKSLLSALFLKMRGLFCESFDKQRRMY